MKCDVKAISVKFSQAQKKVGLHGKAGKAEQRKVPDVRSGVDLRSEAQTVNCSWQLQRSTWNRSHKLQILQVLPLLKQELGRFSVTPRLFWVCFWFFCQMIAPTKLSAMAGFFFSGLVSLENRVVTVITFTLNILFWWLHCTNSGAFLKSVENKTAVVPGIYISFQSCLITSTMIWGDERNDWQQETETAL